MSEKRSNDGNSKEQKRKQKSKQRSVDQPDEEPSSSNPRRAQKRNRENTSDESFKDARSDDTIYYDPRSSSTKDILRKPKLKKRADKTPLQAVSEESSEAVINKRTAKPKPESIVGETTEADDETEQEKVRKKKSKKKPEPEIETKPEPISKTESKSEPEPAPKREKRKPQKSELTPESAPVISVTQFDEIADETAGETTLEPPAPVNTEDELRKFKMMAADYEDSDDEETYQERWADMVRRDKNQTPNDERPSRSSKIKKKTSAMSIMSTNLKTGGAFVYMVVPPDGGYGWLILLISFLSQMIVDGIIFSLGIILPTMAEDLGSSPSNIALVASTQIGPISSAFINKFGFRPVALLGATMAITTITIATFSPNVPMLIIFYSVIGGVSLSMIWVSSQLIIGYYFEKYRPIASGVSCSGAGAGVLLFSYINGILSQNFGWRNTIRFHVLCLMIVFMMAWTYIEVAPTRIGRVVEVIDTESDSLEQGDFMHTYRFSRMTWHNVDLNSSRYSKIGIPSRLHEMDATSYAQPSRMNLCFQACCPPFKSFMQRREASVTLGDVKPHKLLIEQDPYERPDLFYTGPVDYDDVPPPHQHEIVHEGDIDIEVETEDPEKLRAINYKLAMMPERDEQPERYSAAEVKEIHVGELKDTNAFWEFISPRHWLHPKIQKALFMLFDFRLLRLLEFQVLLASAFLFPMGMNIPFVYSKQRAEIATSFKDLISPTIGLSNFFFRIASGFVAYKYKTYTTYICGSGITFGGMVTFISAFYGKDIVWFQFLFAICFGVAPAFYSTLRAIIYVRMLGLDKLTNAFGLTAMAMGMGVFIGTYMGGLLFQLTHNYQATFVFSGTCMMLAGSLKLIVPSVVEWKQKHQALHFKVRFAK